MLLLGSTGYIFSKIVKIIIHQEIVKRLVR